MHLEALLHLFAYLNKKHNAWIIFDLFKECDWKHFYGDVHEAIPPNAPPTRGKDINLHMFVDSDYSGDQLMQWSCSGFFIYMNMAPIVWFSKKQATIETSVFGAEFVTMNQGMEALRGLRYKLRMMGVSISGPLYLRGQYVCHT
jgi:hypothetical protein